MPSPLNSGLCSSHFIRAYFVVSLCSGFHYHDNGTKAREQQNQPIADFFVSTKKQNQANADFYSSGLCSDFYSFWLVLFFFEPLPLRAQAKRYKKTKQPIKARAKNKPLPRSAP